MWKYMTQTTFGPLIDGIAHKLEKELTIKLHSDYVWGKPRVYGKEDFFYTNSQTTYFELWRPDDSLEERIHIEIPEDQFRDDTLPEFIENAMRNQLKKWIDENNS